jgi:8-oxo-dGTP pyrophosphatase MutT (NUDIX family)
MTLRPDLVGCWIFRIGAGGAPEILLIKRAPGRIFPGIWQCVTGKLEPGERVADAALREVLEETGIRPEDIEAFYGLDQVNIFHSDHLDAVEVEAVFAAHVRMDVEAVLSHEHEDLRWLSPADAAALVIWPAYRAAIDQIEWLVRNPQQTRWFRAGPWVDDEPVTD